ncbi:hypothetical protein [Roseovarius tolerans]|uniref:oxidoreductase n=1 Tax=Roseovarius tolerans TaxID=74031 RepID=UPI003B82F743
MTKRSYSDHLELPCGVRLKNRFARSAMTEALADVHDAPNKAHQTLYERWSYGGMAMQMTGNVMVDKRYLERPGNVVVQDESVLNVLQDWARAAKSGGSQVWMQISHPGRQCPIVVHTRPLSPSAEKLRILGLFGKPTAMTSEDIQDAIPLRANNSETFDRLKFTLEGAGERTDGHALTDTTFIGCRVRRHFARRHTCPRRSRTGSPHGRADAHAEAAQLHCEIQTAHSG